jgi:hypothetical protein
MEDKRCPVFVDGKECGLSLTLVDLEHKKIARYDLGIYECSFGHRTYFLLEPKSKATEQPCEKNKNNRRNPR